MKRLQFIPFWRLTAWGFLFGKHEDALRIRRGCDEWHNPSFYTVIPLVGQIVVFASMDRSGEEHLWARSGAEEFGRFVPECDICLDIREEFARPNQKTRPIEFGGH